MRTHYADWHIAFDRPGLFILHAEPRCEAFQSYPLANNGVILGRLFPKTDREDCPSALGRLPQADINAILATWGEELIDRYWGHYVAFLFDANGEHRVLRDPTGALPCYAIRMGSAVLLFSHIEDCADILPDKLTINWAHVAAYLQFSRAIGVDTGFTEIAQVLAGQCAVLRDGRLCGNFLWRPPEICAREPIEEPGRAAAALRQAILSSVRGLAACYERIVLELSGGLDSSLVLLSCCGSAQAPRTLGFNLYTHNAAGDERVFARLAAQKAGCELVEQDFSCSGKSLERMLDVAQLAYPALVSLNSSSEDFLRALVRLRGAQAIFSGRGGDHLLQRRRGDFIAAEYVHRHGLGKSLWPVIRSTAHLTGHSLAAVSRAALSERVFRRPLRPYDIIRPPAFLTPQAVSLGCDRFQHSWVTEAEDLPGAKVQQIFDVVDTQNYFNPNCHYADVVPPLISQPIIECVLRIPSYVLTLGGRERGLARHAFKTQLPPEILNRTVKGEVTSYYRDLLRDNLPFVREFLLDGVLVKERIIDAVKLEKSLAQDALLKATALVPVLTAIKAEAWCQSAMRDARRFVA